MLPSGDAIQPKDREELRTWLSQNFGRKAGLWLIYRKKIAGVRALSYDEIVEECLCFGWVDSKPNALDAEKAMLWIAPRKPGTNWSKKNKQRIENLIQSGRMAEPGLAKVRQAQADGSWTALDEVENLVVPDDLRLALHGYPQASGYFEAFPRSVKRAILEWIQNAKTPSTRQKRIDETARSAQDNVRANQWRQP